MEPRVTDEELAVGLLMPHADADARGWKLVVRMLQSGRLDSAKVQRLAHMERADALLHFLLAGLPESEHTAPIAELDDLARRAPRGYRGVSVQYDLARLVKRPATRGALCRPKPARR